MDHHHTPKPKRCAATGCREMATRDLVLDMVKNDHGVDGRDYVEAYVWRDVCPAGHKTRPPGMRQ